MLLFRLWDTSQVHYLTWVHNFFDFVAKFTQNYPKIIKFMPNKISLLTSNQPKLIHNLFNFFFLIPKSQVAATAERKWSKASGIKHRNTEKKQKTRHKKEKCLVSLIYIKIYIKKNLQDEKKRILLFYCYR